MARIRRAGANAPNGPTLTVATLPSSSSAPSDFAYLISTTFRVVINESPCTRIR